VSNALKPTTANRESESVATLNPNRELRVGATYQVVVTTGVKDTAGDALDANQSWTFTVPDECSGCTPA
jgi:Big-like domain-containing protein